MRGSSPSSLPRYRVGHVRLVSIFAILLATACEPDASADARTFLDRLDRLNLDDPPDQRRRLVENLAHLPLASTEIREVRDICVDAHRNLLEAEDLHQSARRRLAPYAEEGSRMPAAVGPELERELAAATRARDRAGTLFTRCLERRRGLELRYRRRRR